MSSTSHLFFFFNVVLGFELMCYTLSHSTSPFFCWVFPRQSLANYLPKLVWNWDPPDLSAFWVNRTIGVSHQCLGTTYF
jgi:hypothetical protein